MAATNHISSQLPAPLVSVVLPAWNAARTLGATLQSLLEQRPAPDAPLPEFEIIVADDGSTDDTCELLEYWANPARCGHRLRALHLNDSKNPCGSHKDRHEQIGKGFLGIETFRRIVNHPALRGLPMFLETPNDLSGYQEEIALLRSLEQTSK